MNVYSDWAKVPPRLKTKTGLRKMGLKLKRGQQPVAIKRSWWGSKSRDYNLYDRYEAEEIVLSDNQKAAIEKARAASLAKRTCKRCGFVQELGRRYRGKILVEDHLCDNCRWQDQIKEDHQEAVLWAARILDGLTEGSIKAHEVLILDSETTDLHGEIIDLAMVDLAGNVIYNQRFKPKSNIAPDAQAIHGLSADDLADCPDFAQEYTRIKAVLDNAGKVLIYNAGYDVGCLRYTCTLHDVAPIKINDECLMVWYSQFVGEWSDYHRDYRWQRLPGGDHSAIGDCRASLDVLQQMAAARDLA